MAPKKPTGGAKQPVPAGYADQSLSRLRPSSFTPVNPGVTPDANPTPTNSGDNSGINATPPNTGVNANVNPTPTQGKKRKNETDEATSAKKPKTLHTSTTGDNQTSAQTSTTGVNQTSTQTSTRARLVPNMDWLGEDGREALGAQNARVDWEYAARMPRMMDVAGRLALSVHAARQAGEELTPDQTVEAALAQQLLAWGDEQDKKAAEAAKAEKERLEAEEKKKAEAEAARLADLVDATEEMSEAEADAAALAAQYEEWGGDAGLSGVPEGAVRRDSAANDAAATLVFMKQGGAGRGGQ